MNRRQRRRAARLKRASIAGPIVLVVGWYLGGLALSPTHSTRAEVVVAATAEQLWTVLTDLDGMPSWRQDLTTVQRLPAGRGMVRWLEVRAGGVAVALERVEARPPARLVVQVADDHDAGRWIFQISPQGSNSRVVVIEERTVRNPLLRVLVRLFDPGQIRVNRLSHDLEYRLAGAREQIAGTGLDERRPGQSVLNQSR
jgi:uncharacterized protein YndB with AHSA1/START domain